MLEKIGEISQENVIKLNIPETVFFRKGKGAFLLGCSRDRSLKIIKTGEKLKNHEIMKSFTNIVRNRRKEDSPTKSKSQSSQNQINQQEYGKEIALVRLMSKDKDNDMVDIAPIDEEGPIRVMVELDFMNLM